MTLEQRLRTAPAAPLPFPELHAGNLGVRVAATEGEIDAVFGVGRQVRSRVHLRLG